ncbi:MAG: hypothetical protein FJ026_08515, partial [Chloroflexi bacterium]|nr:hypothetical protein [Chloroflexota bacterium]
MAKKGRKEMPKAGRVLIALSVTALLFLALAVLVQEGRGPTVAKAQGYSYHTLRVYGNGYEGAGDTSKQDPYTKLYPEDPPYTDPEAIFNPQLPQAPRKDSITFNPIFMSEFETFDENHAQGLYNQIFAGTRNATQKVWFRMWYEPWHWDKDVDANGKLELFCTITGCRNLTGTLDEWYPAVMQEFTYMLLEADLLANEPKPLAGQVGRTSFVFPVGMRPYLLFNESGGVDSTSAQARYGWGLTSLDGDFDGIPDIVHVESEWTLFDKTRVAADFNGNGSIDPLDPDTTALNGNELAIFRLGTKPLAVGAKIQFLDHMAIVKAIFINSVQLEIYYLGDMIPVSLGSRTIYVGDMLLSGSSGPGQLIPAGGHNLCDFPTGPWFVYLDSIDRAENKARLMVGRALGATWSAMEDRPFQADTRPGDPWFLKRFYVDGHEYNVVAIMTEGGGQDPWYTAKCPLNDSVPWPPRPEDRTRFKFITIRTPVPKAGTYDDPLIGHPIEQHSVRLQPYAARDRLSVMPPYNHEHYIVPDVQAIQQFTCKEEDVRYCGLSTGMEKQVTAAEEPVKAFDLADRSKSLGEVVPDEVIIRFRSPAAGQLLANRLAVAGQASRWLRDEAMADIEPLPKEILGLQPFAAGQARALQTLRAHAKLSKLAQSLEAGQALARDQVAVVADALYAAMEPDDPMNMFYAQVAEGTDLRELCLALMKRPDVEYANPSRVYYTEGSPNDVNFYRQWNLDRIRMPQAWDSASNTYDPNGVKVCVVDSGVRISHQELSGRTAYPKDVYLANGDAYGNADPNDDDLDGHGTAVAGIIAAKRDNSLGIAGIAPVTIIPVNANGCPVGDGACGKISHFEDGIYWGVEHGAAVINCSFGSYAYAPFPSELAAVNYAASRGVLVVSTSGNTNNEGTTT